MKPVMLIDGAYGHGNMGDELMLTAIREAIGPPTDRLWVLTADVEDTQVRHGVPAFPRDHRYAPGGTLSRLLRSLRVNVATVRVLRKADAYIIGGGSLLTDERGALPLLRYATLSRIARLLGKPTFLMGVGVGPLESRLARLLVRGLLRSVPAALVRDDASAEQVRALSRHTGTVATRDLVLTLDLPSAPTQPRPDVLGVSLRDIPPSRYYVRNDSVRDRFYRNIAAALDSFVAATGASVRFIPFQALPGAPTRRLDDVRVSREVAGRMTHADRTEVRSMESVDELVTAITECGLLLGERFHSLVLALVTGTPFLAIDYHPKVTELLVGVGLQEQSVALSELLAETMDPGLLADRLASAWSRRRDLADQVGPAVEPLRETTRADVRRFVDLMVTSVSPATVVSTS